LGVDDRRNDRQQAASNDRAQSFRRASLAPLQRDQHSGVESERHAARRRRFFGVSPRHSASTRSIASSSSGGTPYLSKNASAATNFASRDAISARRAETFPLCRRAASALRFLSVAASREKLVVFVLPDRIMAV